VIRAKDLLIAKPKPQLANLRRHRFGAKSEALGHVIEQLQLMLEDIEASTAESAEAANTGSPADSSRAPPKRKPLPGHLPREEVVLSPGDTPSVRRSAAEDRRGRFPDPGIRPGAVQGRRHGAPEARLSSVIRLRIGTL